jgi:hypothetical protein
MGQPVPLGSIPLASTLLALWASLLAGLLTSHCAYYVMGYSVIYVHNINLIYGPIRTLRIGQAVMYAYWPGFADTLSAPMRQAWLVRYIRVRVTDSCRKSLSHAHQATR